MIVRIIITINNEKDDNTSSGTKYTASPISKHDSYSETRLVFRNSSGPKRICRICSLKKLHRGKTTPNSSVFLGTAGRTAEGTELDNRPPGPANHRLAMRGHSWGHSWGHRADNRPPGPANHRLATRGHSPRDYSFLQPDGTFYNQLGLFTTRC